MGLLDEAIRQHLDLKRRRGADPQEIERAEHEALGPARRPTEADQADVSALPEEELGIPPVFEPEASPGPGSVEEEEQWSEPFDQETEIVSPEDRLPPEPAPAVEEPFEERDSLEPDDLDDLELPPDPTPPPVSEHPEQETEEYDVDLEGEGETGEDEAMLEETPEFLQDTPEHDRLWFEQRPPRDFDFDD